MNRWTLVALLVGIGLGYLLSEALQPPSERGRAARAPGAEDKPSEWRRPVRRTERSARGEPADRGPVATDIVVPGEGDVPAETDEGEGLLRVDFGGLPDAEPLIEIHGTDIEGRDEFEEYSADEGTRVEFAWREGTFRVTWRDGGAMHRCAARVRIDAGRVTDVDAADPRYRLPEPANFAVLTVRVPAAGGGWRAGAEVSLGSDVAMGVNTIFGMTNLDGYARFRVKEGTHTLYLGHTFEQRLTLGAGERHALTPAHGARGDVVVEPACPGTYVLWRANSGWALQPHRGSASAVFVEEGTYALAYDYRNPSLRAPFSPSSVRLGEVRVVAGRTTVLRHDGRPGALDVRVNVARVADVARYQWSVRVGHRVPTRLQAGEPGLVARVGGLDPGLYTVEILADGVQRVRTTALVGFDSTTRVNVTVRR